MLVAAGLLLLAPGVVTDIAGLALFAIAVASQVFLARPTVRTQRA